MKSFLLFLLLLLQLNGLAQSLIIEKVNIVDVTNGHVLKNQYVKVEGNIITQISSKKIRGTGSSIKAKGKFLVPGLWDMHVHLSLVSEASLPLFVLNGVTGVRDMGGDWNELKNWRTQSEKDFQFTYPRIKTAGPILESPAFYGLLRKLLGPNAVADRIPINSTARAEQVIDSLKSIGVDFIKARTVLSNEIFESIAAACKKNSIKFTGHVDNGLNLETAIQAGIASIEHDLFFQILSLTEKEQNTIIDLAEANDVWFCPTLSATFYSKQTSASTIDHLLDSNEPSSDSRQMYLAPQLTEQWRIENKLSAFESPLNWDSLNVIFQSFSEKLASKTELLAGTDTGVKGIFPGWGMHEELQRLVNELHVTPLRALQSATIDAAKFLKIDDEYGSIAQGKRADLILLNANPLLNIENIKSQFAIIKNGKLIDQKLRNEMLQHVAQQVSTNSLNYQQEKLNHFIQVIEEMTKGK